MADVRVLVVDDQEPFRRAMATVVEATDGFVVVGMATTGEESLAAAASLQPDLVLMDVNLPGIDGAEAAALVSAAAPGSRTVLCSTYRLEDLRIDPGGPGIAGYLHKEELGAPVLLDLWNRISTAA